MLFLKLFTCLAAGLLGICAVASLFDSADDEHGKWFARLLLGALLLATAIRVML